MFANIFKKCSSLYDDHYSEFLSYLFLDSVKKHAVNEPVKAKLKKIFLARNRFGLRNTSIDNNFGENSEFPFDYYENGNL